MMQTAHVDTVLLDLHMAGMDGFRFLEALGRMRKPPPVIVTTSFGDRNTVLRVLKLGAIDFLRKPVDLTEMLARIRKVLA
jgi:DNA-binding response OmpR family regulator